MLTTGAVFQSFLFWMLLLNSIACFCALEFNSVSILLILDVAFEQLNLTFRKAPKNVFQSFLFWMLLLNDIRRDPFRLQFGVSILLILDVAFEHSRAEWLPIYGATFQSFLFWMLLLNLPGTFQRLAQ